MKIACITWSYDEHQGISRCVVELTARLAARHDVHVYAAEVATEPRPGVHVHPVPLRHRRAHVADYDFFFRAGRLVRRGRPDLVHAHFPVWGGSDVYTCHGMARAALRSWRSFPAHARGDVASWKMARWYLQLPLYAYMARRAGTSLAAVSRKTQDELAQESGRSRADIHVVPNGVDLQRFHPACAARLRAPARRELGLAEDAYALVWVGNHLRHKGMRYALGTLRRLPPSAVLLAVGGDREDSVPELAPEMRALQAEGRLRLLPADRAIERYYAAGDALLFPSLYESFGLVVLEAMAMGKPVICPRTVAFADEHVEDGVNGCVVDHPWQTEALAARVRALMQDPLLGTRIGAAARRTALRFGWDAYVEATEAVYRCALAARANDGGWRRAARVHETGR